MSASLLRRLAALSGAIAVAAGAYGAHGASGAPAEWLKTGATYQMVHAVAVLALALAGLVGIGAWLLLGGSAIFAGTLYAMALGAPHWLGAVTPLGGLAMIVGWLLLALRR
ncbi:DUF423 domain-containing protein [Sphingomonas sp. BIUV-7]|uniref:DUF423 domain-containing protein n=1 Tax=Sphingomonas natans TaxID=3063330 RepID=A0ABT8Y5J4_9SPHN|nr:DUF423 domain-containing protein [Sphingomonas sp. BIUV-7]MDO6413596.1 DUF423 domain-containing protein [Sphingomonas sp. BIUV-7]